MMTREQFATEMRLLEPADLLGETGNLERLIAAYDGTCEALRRIAWMSRDRSILARAFAEVHTPKK